VFTFSHQSISPAVKSYLRFCGSYNTVTKSASSTIVESGSALLSTEQYREIISANSVAVQIQGSKRTVTYEEKEIAKSFIPNLKDFFHQYVEYR
jgi:hypothetical protein